MYYSHSGLTGPPFQLTSSPAQLYMSTEHREAYAALEWGLLHEPSGAILRAHSEFLVRTAIARRWNRAVYVSATVFVTKRARFSSDIALRWAEVGPE